MRNFIMLISCFLLSYSIHCQEPFELPNDLQINPNDFTLMNLDVKKIIQFKEYSTAGKMGDTTQESHQYLEYIINYDSHHRISSLKYSFSDEYYPNFNGDSLTMDSLKKVTQLRDYPVYFLKLNNQWKAFTYWEVLFSYNEYGLNKLEILNPYQRLGVSGIIDGVYLKEMTYNEIRIQNHLNDRGEVIEVDKYLTSPTDSLIWQEFYTYETFKHNGHEARLLTKSKINGEVYDIKYFFKD